MGDRYIGPFDNNGIPSPTKERMARDRHWSDLARLLIFPASHPCLDRRFPVLRGCACPSRLATSRFHDELTSLMRVKPKNFCRSFTRFPLRQGERESRVRSRPRDAAQRVKPLRRPDRLDGHGPEDPSVHRRLSSTVDGVTGSVLHLDQRHSTITTPASARRSATSPTNSHKSRSDPSRGRPMDLAGRFVI